MILAALIAGKVYYFLVKKYIFDKNNAKNIQ